MKRLLGLVCLVSVLGLASTSFALDPLLIGNFEDPISGGRYDNWLVNDDSSPVTDPAQAATLETHSMKWVDADGGWGDNITKPFGEYGGTLEANIYYQALLNPSAVIAVDITAVPGEVADYCSIVLHWNASGGWGFDDVWQNVIIDGQPHTYVFAVHDNLRTVIEDSFGGWGCNIGILMDTGGGSTTLYLDNIWIYPEGISNPYKPHDRSVEQFYNASDSNYADVTLKWKAAANPGDPQRLPDPNVIYNVNPDIVDQYVFMRETGAADPNLYYVGATGVDPGLTDPNSQYGPIILPTDTSYVWVVVEAMDGHEQSFTVDVSSLLDVDPNNIIGPNWPFSTLTTRPMVDVQPVSTKLAVADASAQFTIVATSATGPTSYQWFYSTDAVINDPGDTEISGATTDTLTITSHDGSNQGYYYCRLANATTVSGGGTKDDTYSDVVTLVVERKIAEYLFDGNLNDTSGEGNNGAGVGSPTFVTGVGGSGSALSLDGFTQYVEIYDGDPNHYNNAFPRADLLAEDGIGGGLDVGTITCWVKLDATVVGDVSPIMYNGNGGWPHTEYVLNIPTVLDTQTTFTNTNLHTHIWGNTGVLLFWMEVNPVWADPFNMGGDGQWHMLATTWDMNGTVSAYVDGNLLAAWSAQPSTFTAWDAAMKIGFDGTNYFGGLIDNLIIYNYEISAEDIVAEYYAATGKSGCIYDFSGSSVDANQLGTSYCKLDLADFAALAAVWLHDGFYTPAP
jgi:hypothetical protein